MSFDQSTAVCANAVATAQDTAAVNDDCCEVCLVAERDARIALVPCGHQRLCELCANELSVRDVVVPSAVLELT